MVKLPEETVRLFSPFHAELYKLRKKRLHYAVNQAKNGHAPVHLQKKGTDVTQVVNGKTGKI